jgi:hypothetical protein
LGKDVALKGSDNSGFWSIALSFHDKSPIMACVIMVLLVSSPIVGIIFFYLGKLSDNKILKHQNLLAYDLKFEKLKAKNNSKEKK